MSMYFALMIEIKIVWFAEEMMYQAQEFSQITPLEIDILFQLIGLKHQTG